MGNTCTPVADPCQCMAKPIQYCKVISLQLKYINLYLKKVRVLSCFKRIASPGSMHDTGCSGLVHWDDPEGWDGEGGGFRMGNTCTPVADSF